jgi:protein involved in polysaccharide export with SLBB domain
MNGDTITIPLRQETVSIVGAVMNPVTERLGDRRKVGEIVRLAGGYAKDADQEGVLIMRVNGTMVPSEDVRYVEEGDIIYVPTKVMSTEILTLGDKIISAVKYTLVTVASVVVFLALIQ